MNTNINKQQKVRKGIAMIELIFAIVILGIVMMSAPMMISNAHKSSQVAFQQESIAILATHANNLMSYAWDESNTYESTTGRFNILETNSTVTALDRDALGADRARRVSTSDTYNAINSGDFGEGVDTNASGVTEPSKDDIDDFHAAPNNLRYITTVGGSVNSTDEGEYMDINITITTTVTYGDDTPASTYLACKTGTTGCAFSEPFDASNDITHTSNIKRIITRFQSNDTDTDIVLKSFMCNIGSLQILSESNL